MSEDRTSKDYMGFRINLMDILDYDFVENLILQKLIESLDDIEKNDDPYETRDHQALTISSFYQVIEYHMAPSEHKAWMSKRKCG